LLPLWLRQSAVKTGLMDRRSLVQTGCQANPSCSKTVLVEFFGVDQLQDLPSFKSDSVENTSHRLVPAGTPMLMKTLSR